MGSGGTVELLVVDPPFYDDGLGLDLLFDDGFELLEFFLIGFGDEDDGGGLLGVRFAEFFPCFLFFEGLLHSEVKGVWFWGV